jgi:hypothetical protein
MLCLVNPIILCNERERGGNTKRLSNLTRLHNIVLFADVTSIIVAKPNHEELQTTINKTFSDVVEWFKANLLSLNLNKTYYIEFKNKKCQDPPVNINYGNKIIKNVTSAKFLVLTIDNLLKWDNHTNQLISKLSSACYVIRSLRAVVSKNTIRMIYFSYVHSIITYGIIFWGKTPNGIKIFKMQKKIIRIMTNSGKMIHVGHCLKE